MDFKNLSENTDNTKLFVPLIILSGRQMSIAFHLIVPTLCTKHIFPKGVLWCSKVSVIWNSISMNLGYPNAAFFGYNYVSTKFFQ